MHRQSVSKTVQDFSAGSVTVGDLVHDDLLKPLERMNPAVYSRFRLILGFEWAC